MSISSILGSCGLYVQSVVNACGCSSSEVNSSSGQLPSPSPPPPPIRPLPRPTSHPLNSDNLSRYSTNCVNGFSKVERWLKKSRISE